MKRIAFALSMAVFSPHARAFPTSSPACIINMEGKTASLFFSDGTFVSKRTLPNEIRAFVCTSTEALLVDSYGAIQYHKNTFDDDGVVGTGFSFSSGITHAGTVDGDSVWFVTSLGNVGIAYISPSGTPEHILSKTSGGFHTFLDNNGPVTLSCNESGCLRATAIGAK